MLKRIIGICLTALIFAFIILEEWEKLSDDEVAQSPSQQNQAPKQQQDVPSPQDTVEAPFNPNNQSSMKVASSWGSTKSWARDKVYYDHQITFYCGCNFSPRGKGGGGTIDQESCQFDSSGASYAKRARQMEWEHIVPASLMPARDRACWNEGLPSCKKGGRHCCEKHDDTAKKMMFDLHNLAPSIGQVNALRSNKPYGAVEGENYLLGACDFEWTKELAEPPTAKQGEVARTWLYMHDVHGVELSQEDKATYIKWHQEDPPTEWEKQRNRRIYEIQGIANHYIEEQETLISLDSDAL